MTRSPTVVLYWFTARSNSMALFSLDGPLVSNGAVYLRDSLVSLWFNLLDMARSPRKVPSWLMTRSP